jgi:hypothetical protein
MLRILKGFLDSPAEWDGLISRRIWLDQFHDIAITMLSTISRFNGNLNDKVATLIGRTLDYANNAALASDCCKIPLDLLIKLTKLSDQFDSVGITVGYSKIEELDIDTLFATYPSKVALQNSKANIYSVVCQSNTITDCNSTDIVKQEKLISWCIQKVYAGQSPNPFLRWINKYLVTQNVFCGNSIKLELSSIAIAFSSRPILYNSTTVVLAMECGFELARDLIKSSKKRKSRHCFSENELYKSSALAIYSVLAQAIPMLDQDSKQYIESRIQLESICIEQQH